MPTYQRLIKKSRLKKVAEFVEDGGFFPNSIILNVESGSAEGGLQFDPAGKSPSGRRLGLLHLPQTYRAAYVIDGQHRLYGYANSDRAETDLIPVVAFVDLPGNEQVELFMQINENQQAVPKNLRNTLNSDLLWNSETTTNGPAPSVCISPSTSASSKSSPLFDRVIIGENPKTITAVHHDRGDQQRPVRGNFIGTLHEDRRQGAGHVLRRDNQPTAKLLIPFLEGAFRYLVEGLPRQGALGSAEGGFVFMNNGIEASCASSATSSTTSWHEDVDPLKASTEGSGGRVSVLPRSADRPS